MTHLFIVGEIDLILTVGVHHINLPFIVASRFKHDLRSVGGPSRTPVVMLTLGQLPRVRPIRVSNMDVARLTTCWPGNKRQFLSRLGQRGGIQIEVWHAGRNLLD